jgi:hypothetical protein
MSSQRMKAGLAVVGFLALACFALGQAPQKNDAGAEDQEVVSSKVSQRPAAASVNFRKELGLPFASLSTLGARIATARRDADPVALANAANELAVAEKVSGKKASLTSTTLGKEAAELAALRRQQAELEAVLHVNEQITQEQDTIANLRKTISLSKQIANADVEAFRKNEEPTWTPRKVLVNNYTTQNLLVYVNGSSKWPMVPPGGAQMFVIEHRWNPTVLTATGDQDIDTWGPRYIWGRFNKYTWNIN